MASNELRERIYTLEEIMHLLTKLMVKVMYATATMLHVLKA